LVLVLVLFSFVFLSFLFSFFLIKLFLVFKIFYYTVVDNSLIRLMY
jgi:hypothetical protein